MLQLQHYVAMKGIRGRRRGVVDDVDATDRILAEIIATGKEGISQKDLASRADAHRITVYRETKKFSNQGKITILKSGRRRSYVAGYGAYDNAELGAYMIGRNFMFYVLGQKDCILCKDPYLIQIKDSDYDSVTRLDLTNYRDYFLPRFTQGSELEEMLFEFSNQVGAYITFLFIQFMNSENKLLALPSRYSGDTDKHDIIRQWMKSSISSIIPEVFNRFRRECLSRLRHGEPQSVDVNVDKIASSSSRFELDKKSISNLSTAFENLYPFLNFRLVNIMKNLHRTVDKQKQLLDEYEKLYKRQADCKHDWRNTVMKDFKQCIKCEKIVSKKGKLRF